MFNISFQNQIWLLFPNIGCTVCSYLTTTALVRSATDVRRYRPLNVGQSHSCCCCCSCCRGFEVQALLVVAFRQASTHCDVTHCLWSDVLKPWVSFHTFYPAPSWLFENIFGGAGGGSIWELVRFAHPPTPVTRSPWTVLAVNPTVSKTQSILFCDSQWKTKWTSCCIEEKLKLKI